MNEKYQFTTKTNLNEILALDINVVAKLRWDEYQKCYNAKNFLWWEFLESGDKSPVENFQLMYDGKFNIPLPIDLLAQDFMLYIELKEQIISVINELNLSDYYLLYLTDYNKYMANYKEREFYKKLAKSESCFKNHKNVNSHLRIVH